MEDDEIATRWTHPALDDYERAGEVFVAALTAHLTRMREATGSPDEAEGYMRSLAALRAAAVAFDDAEIAWCGDSPLGISAEDFDDADDEFDWEDVVDAAQQNVDGAVLSVVGRWDLEITDTQALVEAGREAYLRAWPDDTQEDAVSRIQEPGGAISEIIHADGPGVLETGAPGVQTLRSILQFVVSPAGAGTDIEDERPFDIAYRDEGDEQDG